MVTYTTLVNGIDIAVEAGFGFTWKSADGHAWVNITSDVLDVGAETIDGSGGIRTKRGRSDATQQFNAGSLNLTLKNEARQYDPLYTAGAHFGDLVPGVPIRVMARANAVERAVWRGYVVRWPQRYDLGNKWSVVPVQAYDGFSMLARAGLPRSVYDAEVLADTPDAYWKQDDSTEASMLDSSGNQVDGLYDNPQLSQDPVAADGGKSVYYLHVGDHRGKVQTFDLPTGFPATIECWVNLPDRDLTIIRRLVGVQRDAAYGSSLDLEVQTSAGGSPDGQAVFNFRGLGSFWKRRGSTRIDDGEDHHLVLSMTNSSTISLYVDGVAETLTTISGTAGGTWADHNWWVVGNTLDTTSGDWGAEGYVDNVAVYPSALSAARVLAHYEAGSAPLYGDRTDQVVTWALDQVGWPASLRVLEVGQSLVGDVHLSANEKALSLLQVLERTEDGRLFMTGDGKVRFLDRYYPLTATEATTSQFTFVDDGTDYSDIQIDPADDTVLVNKAQGSRRGGEVIETFDQTSVDAYEEATESLGDLLLRSDNEVRSLLEHVVATRKDLKTRVTTLRIPLHHTGYTAANRATILGLDIGHRVTVQRTPQGIGSAISVAVAIEGVNHDITASEWWMELYVSEVFTDTDLGLWGTSNWGTGTWAY